MTKQIVPAFCSLHLATLIINSDGGDVAAALALYDALVGRDLDTVATGACQSAATIVLQAGQTRCATPNTYFRVHRPTAANALVLGRETETVEMIIHSIYKKRISESHLSQLYGTQFLDAEEALQLGLIDKILE